MKNFARFLALCLIATILASGLFAVSAAVDSTPPIIHSITIENHSANKTYGPNDKLKVNMSVTDNISIAAIFVYVTNIKTGKEFIRDIPQPAIASKYTLEFSFETCVSGDYYVSRISTCDSAGNVTEKLFTPEDSYYCFSVNNPKYNPSAPIVKNFKLTPTKGHSQTTKFTFTAVVEPTGSEKVSRVTLDIGTPLDIPGGTCNTLDLEPTGKKNEYSITTTFKDRFSMALKNPEVQYLQVNTTDGEFYNFYPEDSTYWDAKYFLPNITRKDLILDFTDLVEDKEPPKLVSYKYVSSDIYTPDSLKVIVNATDNLSQPSIFQVYFGKEENPDYTDFWNPSFYSKPLEKSYDIPKYFGNGTFFIKKIILRDERGNTSTYLLENGDFEKKTFTVHDTAEADYYTSVTSTDFLDVIRTAAEEKGKTVVINISKQNPTVPKAVFEIIAGKDVTVIFEKMYDYSSSSGESDDGIEWVMYGKHIDIAKAKDINAYINIKQEDWRDEAVRKLFKKPSREKGNTFIRIIFADNGELPGKATIRFKPGFTLRGLVNEDDMRLYYLNEKSSSVDLVASNIKAEKTGYFHLNITHNSSYAFVGEYAGSSSENNGNSGISNGNVSSKSESTSKNESEVSSSQATEEINRSEVTNTSSSVTTIGSIPEKDSNALTIVLIILGAVILLGGSAFGYIYYKKKTAKAKENNISDAE